MSQKGDQTSVGSDDREPHATLRPRSTAEWTTLVISSVVVALLIGAALYEHYGREEISGVSLSVEVMTEDGVRREEMYYVPFTVTNHGAAPARDVTIMFEVRRGEDVLEESTVLVPFLANSGSADGTLVTSFDPATHKIEARPATFLNP